MLKGTNNNVMQNKNLQLVNWRNTITEQLLLSYCRYCIWLITGPDKEINAVGVVALPKDMNNNTKIQCKNLDCTNDHNIMSSEMKNNAI